MMDFSGNHRHHPYAPPAVGRFYPGFPAREWHPQDHGPFPNAFGKGQRGQFSVRGRGSHRLGERKIYRSPLDHVRFGRPSQSAPSNVLSFPSTSSTRIPNNVSNPKTKTAEFPGTSKEMSVIYCAAQSETLSSSKVNSDLSCKDKEPSTSEVRSPSIAKVVPFSHQPSVSSGTSSVGTSKPSPVEKVCSNTICQNGPESPTVSTCNSLTSLCKVNLAGEHCHASKDGLMTVCARDEDGHLQPIFTTICSCQLRKRALKYADKGTTRGDSIVIDSDEEEDSKSNIATIKLVNEGAVEALLSTVSPSDSPNGEGEPSFQETPRKRAKMSTTNVTEKISFPVDKATTAGNDPEETDKSSNGTCTGTMAGTLAKIVEGVQQNLREGCCSSTSSDSLLPLSSSNLIEDAPLLSNPQILQRLLDECNEIAKPFNKLKVSSRNLLTAAKECNVHKVLALLVEGCDPNQQVAKSKGKTAMHAAAAGGYVDIIACLRLGGCDLNLLDYDNRTPLFDAVNNHKVKAVEYLIECGANLTLTDTKGMTCFHVAVRHGHTDLIQVLLKTGQIDINDQDDGGWTPIMWAAEDKQYDATQVLIENGANLHIRDLEFNVPLHWAALSGNIEVCKLLLDEHTDINSINIHKETPLHIAAREDHYACVQLFLSRGANIHIRNKDGHTPCEVAHPVSRGYCLLDSKAQLESRQGVIRPRILHSDISRGQENVSVSCINEVDDEPFPKFTFVKESCEVYDGLINWSISKFEGCKCENSCQSGKSCHCSEKSEREKIWYNKDGLLKGDLQKFDRPLIFECNRMCNCWSFCKNRVVQKGMQYPLQMFRTVKKGWGVRSLAVIPQGGFVCEYTGELIPDSEADDRDDDSYLFDLDCKESTSDLFCIDAKEYGNISRFINHSCEPNIFPLRVFINHRDIRFPRIAFFATKDINLHEEICFNYGDRFWSVKKKEFYCECGTPRCKYRNPSS